MYWLQSAANAGNCRLDAVSASYTCVGHLVENDQSYLFSIVDINNAFRQSFYCASELPTLLPFWRKSWFPQRPKLCSVQFSSVRYTLKTYVLRGSGVGLGEEVGLQPPSKLSTTDGGRAQKCKRSYRAMLCIAQIMLSQDVCLSVIRRHCVEMAKVGLSSNFFHRRVAKPF